ncbi:hypothetical protein CYMTET_20787 [Cymbomonas tetramitiformis]|uniref:tRNA threonylcarbamoyladenosine biosynthesis protein TsaE n=1 Tax=Cymbomonas tetramitiformis TaxID=36881 RepID=A0AAE0L3W9_9CHLO|nr:hypothetical protein CYMTET_20787 [Cymbomonas tetramitiformis]
MEESWPKLRMLAPTEEHTNAFAEIISQVVKVGDCICFYGKVGAGKSTFSRAFIRSLADDEHLVVPSPTFMLQLVYEDHQGPPIHHFDLYRLRGPCDFANLDLRKSLRTAISLIEWAERLETEFPPEYLELRITSIRQGVKLPPAGATFTVPLEEQEGYAGIQTEDLDLVDEVEVYSDTCERAFDLIPHGPRWEALVARMTENMHLYFATTPTTGQDRTES